MKVFLVLLLAHIIADFLTQTKHMIQYKYIFSSSHFSKGIFYHCIHHVGTSFILSVFFLDWSFSFLLIIPMIGIIHYVIDLAKIKLEEYLLAHHIKEQYKNQTWYHLLTEKKILIFMGDQFAHLISIYLILLLFGSISNGEFIQLFTLEIIEQDGGIRYLLLFILLVLVTYPSAYFISILMGDLESKTMNHEVAASLSPETKHIEGLQNKIQDLHTDLVITETYQDDKENYSMQVQYHKFYNKNEDPRGRYIGMLERMLIVIFIVHNLFQGLALIIAMKTLTRFKQFEDKRFAEYYLIGTLSSLLIGIIFAFMIKKIW